VGVGGKKFTVWAGHPRMLCRLRIGLRQSRSKELNECIEKNGVDWKYRRDKGTTCAISRKRSTAKAGHKHMYAM